MNVQHVTYLTYVTYITYHLLLFFTPTFLSDPGVPGVRSMGPDVSKSLREYVET